jgi:hypothetical protein
MNALDSSERVRLTPFGGSTTTWADRALGVRFAVLASFLCHYRKRG